MSGYLVALRLNQSCQRSTSCGVPASMIQQGAHTKAVPFSRNLRPRQMPSQLGEEQSAHTGVLTPDTVLPSWQPLQWNLVERARTTGQTFSLQVAQVGGSTLLRSQCAVLPRADLVPASGDGERPTGAGRWGLVCEPSRNWGWTGVVASSPVSGLALCTGSRWPSDAEALATRGDWEKLDASALASGLALGS